MKKSSYEFESLFDKENESQRLNYRAAARLSDLVPELQKIGLNSKMRVLDVGSGTGRRTFEIAKFLKTGEIVGIDSSQELLTQALKNKPRSLKNTKFLSADVMAKKSLNLLGKFDLIHMRLVVQHLNNPIQALKNLRSILKPGGIIFIEDTDRDWVSVVPTNAKWEKLYAKVKKGQTTRGGDPRSGRKLGWYLSKAGFRNVNVKLIPVCGNNDQVSDWLENYVPSFLIHLGKSDRLAGQKIIAEIKRQCAREPMYFYQTWFQASGQEK